MNGSIELTNRIRDHLGGDRLTEVSANRRSSPVAR